MKQDVKILTHVNRIFFYSFLQILLRPLFGNPPFFLQQESINEQNVGTQSSPTFANQLLDDATQSTNGTNSSNGRKRKTRRRENRFGRRGKLINSINHGKTSLTRYRKGELFSGPHESFSSFSFRNNQNSAAIQNIIATNILQEENSQMNQIQTNSTDNFQGQLSNQLIDQNQTITQNQTIAQFSNQILGE